MADNDLAPLIRVHKHNVEQKQKFLSELYRQAEELQTQKQTLLDQLKQEEERAKEMDIAMLSYMRSYASSVQARVSDIDEAAARLEQRIDFMREDIRASFAELKKIEITAERREEAEREALNKKEAQNFDEIAIEGFRRGREESDDL